MARWHAQDQIPAGLAVSRSMDGGGAADNYNHQTSGFQASHGRQNRGKHTSRSESDCHTTARAGRVLDHETQKRRVGVSSGLIGQPAGAEFASKHLTNSGSHGTGSGGYPASRGPLNSSRRTASAPTREVTPKIGQGVPEMEMTADSRSSVSPRNGGGSVRSQGSRGGGSCTHENSRTFKSSANLSVLHEAGIPAGCVSKRAVMCGGGREGNAVAMGDHGIDEYTMNSVLHQSARGNIDPRGASNLGATNPRATVSGLLNGSGSLRKGVSSGIIGQEAGSTWLSVEHPSVVAENQKSLAASQSLANSMSGKFSHAGHSGTSPITHQPLGSSMRSAASSSAAGNTLASALVLSSARSGNPESALSASALISNGENSALEPLFPGGSVASSHDGDWLGSAASEVPDLLATGRSRRSGLDGVEPSVASSRSGSRISVIENGFMSNGGTLKSSLNGTLNTQKSGTVRSTGSGRKTPHPKTGTVRSHSTGGLVEKVGSLASARSQRSMSDASDMYAQPLASARSQQSKRSQLSTVRSSEGTSTAVELRDCLQETMSAASNRSGTLRPGLMWIDERSNP